MDTALFYIFAAMTLVGALLTVVRRNPVHCALALILSLLGVAGLFLMLSAEFLFAVQILLYVGGVMVLFLFVIMLIHVEAAVKLRQYSRQWPIAMAAVAAVFLELVVLIRTGLPNLPPGPAPRLNPPGNTERVADSLLLQYALPFEAASLLLLIAVVGAVWMAQKHEAPE
ncbi:NADH-quinone oxidoreductase subunit J [Bryobacter aggregatus]|uniref:NADH-quinone oxidoreductase subunit J family protein n=1 Tax=Bryobacter aggregatus TaxID=360054 RepID=UPI0004E0C877|nr:NADH-quinone oxidoreductase subunit J [Bryobacter aggregatus]